LSCLVRFRAASTDVLALSWLLQAAVDLLGCWVAVATAAGEGSDSGAGDNYRTKL
jgi:hypothetical protein